MLGHRVVTSMMLCENTCDFHWAQNHSTLRPLQLTAYIHIEENTKFQSEVSEVILFPRQVRGFLSLLMAPGEEPLLWP